MKIAALLLLLFAPTLQAQTSSAARFLTNAELRRTIETAPEEHGHPGLKIVRLSPRTEEAVFGVRTTVAGKAEVHAAFADVWYVLDGAANLVTGGSVVEGVSTAPGELSGQSIRHGDSRRIHKGDFVVIPAGTPHWLSNIDGRELLFVVVKLPTPPPK